MTLFPLEETVSPYRCRDCGDPLLYGRALQIFDFHRAHGMRATRGEMRCDSCDPRLDRTIVAELAAALRL